MKELAAMVAFWLLVSVFGAGAVVWLLVNAWRSAFRYPAEELTPEARKVMVAKLHAIARKRQQEGL